MRLRSFSARTMAEAMAEVRHALGDDAVIVATEHEAQGVRLTAACESASAAMADAPDVADELYEIFAFHRAPPDLTDRLLGATLALNTDDAIVALGGALDATFTFEPLSFDRPAPTPILLVGPPGQGKTLTTARLAVRSVLSGRAAQIIAADTRAGAAAQIAELCRPMNIVPKPLAALDGPAIIDGPAVNPFDGDELLALRDLVRRTGAEPVLVLGAGCDPDDAAEAAEAFAAIGVRRLIATRLDATRRLGGILAATACGLALADGGIGRTVADTLVPMHPLGLARLMLAMRSGATPARHGREVAA